MIPLNCKGKGRVKSETCTNPVQLSEKIIIGQDLYTDRNRWAVVICDCTMGNLSLWEIP